MTMPTKSGYKREKCHQKFKLLISLAMVTIATKPTPEETQMFNEAWNYLNKDSCKNGVKQFEKNL